MVSTSVEWKQGVEFEGRPEGSHRVPIDASEEHAHGPGPLQLLLTALCACTSVDVVSILEKKREPLEGLTVSAKAEQASTPPRVFTHIHLTYRIRGKVAQKAAEDAVSLSKNKYCSVSKMLEKAATIDYSIEYAS
jgi:putative redox protein